jgi:cytochrome P450
MASAAVERFDYPSPEVSRCPYPFYEAVRRDAPVHRLPTGEYVVSRWADLDHVVRHPHIYSSAAGHLRADYRALTGVDGASDEERIFTPWPLPYSDPPEHRLKRQLCQALVARERLAALEPVVRGFARELVAAFADRGSCEFVTEVADVLPLRTMLHLYDLPESHAPRLIELGTAASPEGPGIAFLPEDQAQAAADRKRELQRLVEEQVLDRQAHPRDDLLSEIVQAHIERDGRLDLRYLVAEASNIFTGGLRTTGHMLASTVLKLVERPGEQERLAADPVAIRAFIDETLRLESPVQWVPRMVTEDTELAGVAIPEGATVLLLVGSANRDDERFARPDDFDPGRANLAKDHVAFGRGIHLCIGAPLARLEGQVVVEVLLERLRDIRLAGPDAAVYVPSASGHFRGLERLQLAFDPR